MRLLTAFYVLLVGVLALPPARAGAEIFPRPAAIEPMVSFWTRVYTEVPTNSGLLHDNRHLGVVYERVVVPQNLSRRTRERRIAKAKKRYKAALRSLATGKRTGLSEVEQRVLALWPEGVSNKTLRDAAGRVRFQRGQADKFRDGVIRSGRWRNHIHEIFSAHGLPTDLGALPHVESSFNPRAYSKVGAAGLWQFTRSTGRRFMTVNSAIDERMDPFIATVAAAKLLKANHEITGTWPLAITSYNHGAAGMRRAKRRLGTSDIDVIIEKYRSRTFGFASRNFYAEFLAARDINRNPERYFGPFSYDDPERIETVVLDAYYPGASIAKAFGIEVALLKQLNPSLRSAIWSGQKRVPKNFALRVPPALGPGSAAQKLAALPSSERFDRQTRDRYHRVRRGETLSTIASRYGVSQNTLMSLNDLRSRHRIRAGQRLRLPDDPADRVALRPGRAVAVQPAWEGTEYRVRRGETLDAIARRVGSTPSELAAANGLRNKNRIYVGQVLKVPSGDPAKAIEAPTRSAEPAAASARIADSETTPSAPQPRSDAGTTPQEDPPALAMAEPAKPTAPTENATLAQRVSAETATPAQRISAETATPTQTLVVETPAPPPIAPGAPAAQETEATATAPEANETPALAASPVRGDVDSLLHANPARWDLDEGRVTVQPDETLGHYADWLEVSTQSLRRRNGMRGKSDLVIGRRVELDLSRVDEATFRTRRLAHHRALRVAFLETHAITGTREHVMRRGETLWEISRSRYGIPLWLLRDYNPTLDFGKLQSGARLRIPDVERRAHSSGRSSDSANPSSPA